MKKIYSSSVSVFFQKAGARPAAKFSFLLGLILLSTLTCLATDYYSAGNNAPNLTASWWTNTNGTGSHPGNFTTAGNKFIIQNGHSMTTTATWTVSGAGSTIQVNTGGTLIAANAVTATVMTVASGATYQHNQSPGTIPTATWNANSNCILTRWTSSGNTPSNIAGQTFGNFTVNVTSGGGSNTGALLTADGTITVAGNFTVNNSDRPIALTNGAGDDAVLNITGNLNIQNTDAFTIVGNTGTGTVTVGGNVNISIGATFILKSGSGTTSLSLKGDFTNDGTVTAGTSTVTFNGISAQSIAGANSTTFSNLVFNNSAGGTAITVSKGAIITGSCTLTDGIVSTSASNLLTFNDNATVSGASDNSCVQGPVVKIGDDVFTFPVGSSIGSTGYHPISIGVPLTPPASASNTFKAEYFRSSAGAVDADKTPGIYGISNCEYWKLDHTAGSNNVDVTLRWNGNSDCGGPYISTPVGLIVAWYDAGVDSRWENSQGTSQTVTSSSPYENGTLLRANVSSGAFGYFTFGNTSAVGSPLPVTFGDIKGYAKNNGIQVDWTILTEDNVNHYEVERSADGKRFTSIGLTNARNLGGKNNYGWFDTAPMGAVNFYRIKNVDNDGKFSYSIIIRIDLNKAGTDITIYPNPVQDGHVSFQSGSLQKGNYSVKVYNNSGQQIFNQHLTHHGGAITQSLQLPQSIKPGMYALVLENDGAKIMSKPFMVQ